MNDSMHSLIETVQKNCDIADARHARDYGLCTYLLKMRELYRWHMGFDFATPLASESIGQWIEEKEALWRGLEAEDYAPLPIQGKAFDPFDNEGINRCLIPQNLLYGSGYGRWGRPVFFLAELLRFERLNGYTLLVTGKEYARDLSAPPAMTQGKTLFVRRESVKRMLWEKIEEGGWQKRNASLKKAMEAYPFRMDTAKALEQMTEDVMEDMIAHEVGEAMAGEVLGEAWNAMLMTMAATQGEIMARAARDHLADCLWTLPRILERRHPPSLHAYFAQFSAMRKVLFPSLHHAYRHWLEQGDLAPLEEAIDKGRTHWMAITRQAVELYHRHGERCTPHVEALIKESAF